jgi:hypothetical protein
MNNNTELNIVKPRRLETLIEFLIMLSKIAPIYITAHMKPSERAT